MYSILLDRKSAHSSAILTQYFIWHTKDSIFIQVLWLIKCNELARERRGRLARAWGSSSERSYVDCDTMKICRWLKTQTVLFPAAKRAAAMCRWYTTLIEKWTALAGRAATNPQTTFLRSCIQRYIRKIIHLVGRSDMLDMVIHQPTSPCSDYQHSSLSAHAVTKHRNAFFS